MSLRATRHVSRPARPPCGRGGRRALRSVFVTSARAHSCGPTSAGSGRRCVPASASPSLTLSQRSHCRAIRAASTVRGRMRRPTTTTRPLRPAHRVAHAGPRLSGPPTPSKTRRRRASPTRPARCLSTYTSTPSLAPRTRLSRAGHADRGATRGVTRGRCRCTGHTAAASGARRRVTRTSACLIRSSATVRQEGRGVR